MRSLVFAFYRFVIVPLAFLILQILRPFLSGKIREMIEDKNNHFTQVNTALSESDMAALRPIWIHAASGEIEYARPVIRELKKRHPQIPILVTYSSPSAKKILKGLSDVEVWTALPWDFASSMQNFINKWQPRLVLYSRTDVWPVLAQVAMNNRLPSILFSATFAENSSRLKGLTKYLTAHSLDCLTAIHCVAHEDEQNLKRLKLKTKIVISGDTRFDQVFFRLENPKPLKTSLCPTPEDFVFVAGSTWPEDEDVILPALQKTKAFKIKTILAPHETTPEHMTSLQEKLALHELKWVRYSEAETWGDCDVLLIDQVGILAELYTWADVAFIGGSFKKQVHSVMEALAAGLPVLVGPHHRNNREALYYQRRNFSAGMIVQVIQVSQDISILLERMRKRQFQMSQIKTEIRADVGTNKHSTQRLVDTLNPWLST